MARFTDIGRYTINVAALTYIVWDNAADNPTPKATLHFAGGAPLVVAGDDMKALEQKVERVLLDAEDRHIFVHIKSWPDRHEIEGAHSLVVGTYEVG